MQKSCSRDFIPRLALQTIRNIPNTFSREEIDKRIQFLATSKQGRQEVKENLKEWITKEFEPKKGQAASLSVAFPKRNLDVLALKRLIASMKRATVYFEENLHRALKLKAAEASSSISDLVNEAVKEALAEDLEDLQTFRDREYEPTLNFESFLKTLKSDGRI
jgi:hypothetical protein